MRNTCGNIYRQKNMIIHSKDFICNKTTRSSSSLFNAHKCCWYCSKIEEAQLEEKLFGPVIDNKLTLC